MKLTDLIKEEKSHKHEYGCVMAFFKFPLMDKIHKKILDEDIYIDPDDDSYGLETEPHVTLLYGLHENVSIDEVKEKLKDVKIGDCIAHTLSLFENKDYDVLKFEIRYPTKGGAFLSKANNHLKTLPFTSDYPDYHPHMTIGYLKPGKGKKYTEKFKELEYPISFEHLVYSMTDGKKIKF